MITIQNFLTKSLRPNLLIYSRAVKCLLIITRNNNIEMTAILWKLLKRDQNLW